jgi:SAM-dependent methyltransferase
LFLTKGLNVSNSVLIVMPIFRTELNQSLQRKKRLAKALMTRAEIEEGTKKVMRVKSFEWTTKSRISQIDALTKGEFSSTINNFLKSKKGGKVNILDWGCGDGTAAKELAKHERLNVFGFAIDSSASWLKPEGVTFLHTAVGVLPKFFQRNKMVFDIIYARGSLKHMPIEKQVSHLCELSKSLSLGGRVFPDLLPLTDEIKKKFISAGFLVESKGRYLVSLRKMD